ncbi:MAG: universal stress protein [Candidatus Binatia bacterium]
MDAFKLDRVLFATDFSPDCESAFQYATALAQRFNARLYVLHVLLATEAEQSGESSGRDVAIAERGTVSAMRRLRKALLARHDDYMMAAIPGQHPSRRIVEKARQLGVDLIVLGAHHGAPPPLAHDVVREVCEASPCPVICVPCLPQTNSHDGDCLRE